MSTNWAIVKTRWRITSGTLRHCASGSWPESMKLFLAVALASACSLCAANWPQFRGVGGLGVAAGSPPPVHFGPDSNVLWKATLPSGNSSPVIWGENIFLTGFDKTRLETICLNRSGGKVRWRIPAPATKFEPTHRLGNPATPTPVTDGERVYVSFGSFGLLAYDSMARKYGGIPCPRPWLNSERQPHLFFGVTW